MVATGHNHWVATQLMPRGRDSPHVNRPSARPGFQHHHLLPLALNRRAQIRQFLETLHNNGFRLTDRQTNCLWLPAQESLSWRTGAALHRGPHPRYSDVVIARIDRIRIGSLRLPPGLSEAMAVRRLRRLQRALAYILSGAGPRLVQLNRRDPLRLFEDYSQLDAAISVLHGEDAQLSDDG
jgi:hypothetical protein